MGQIELYSVGHSNHPIDRFIELLQQHRIGSLVDIRRFPASRRLPHFNRPKLAETLQEFKIEYHWLESLGGHRNEARDDSPNGGIRDPVFRNYADHMLGDEFHDGVGQLLAIARQHRTAIMCAEGSFRDCHRRLVSDFLLAGGVTVQHILPTGELAAHTMTAGVKVHQGDVTYPAPRSLLD